MTAPLFTALVPATTANLGPGYDSIGMALALYMTVEVREADEWSVVYREEEYSGLPADRSNLIVQTILAVAGQFGREASPLSLTVSSPIPLGKGLGSSATAIAAGIEIADRCYGLNLSDMEKVRIGSTLEGHADNVAAALLGGVTVAYSASSGELELIRLPAPRIGVVLLIPPNALKTEESRGLLPAEVPHKVAAESSGAGNLLVAAIGAGNWEIAGRMMEKDQFHVPYRKQLLPEFDAIRNFCREHGAFGVTISGAGPSLFIAVREGDQTRMAKRLEQEFPFYRSIAATPSEAGCESKKDARSSHG